MPRYVPVLYCTTFRVANGVGGGGVGGSSPLNPQLGTHLHNQLHDYIHSHSNVILTVPTIMSKTSINQYNTFIIIHVVSKYVLHLW